MSIHLEDAREVAPEEYESRRQALKRFWSAPAQWFSGAEVAILLFFPLVMSLHIASEEVKALSFLSHGRSLLVGVLVWSAAVLAVNIVKPGLKELVLPAKAFRDEVGSTLDAPGWMYHHPHFKSLKREVRGLGLTPRELEVFEAVSQGSTATVSSLVEMAKALD